MRVHLRISLLLLVVAMSVFPLVGREASALDGTPVTAMAAVPDACEAPMELEIGTPLTEAEIDPTTLDLDLLYIDILIPHHETAVTMAGIAQSRSTRPEVVSLAAGIVAAQTPEVEQLRTWREAWYSDVPALSDAQLFAGLETKAASPGAAGAPGLGELSMSGMDAGIATLCAETDVFDLEFIDEMVEHHTGAVLLSELVAAEAVHPEMAAFAQTVVDVQGAEIVTMLGWRDAWYGGYPNRVHGGDGTGTPTT